MAVFFLAGGCERSESASVEGVFECQQTPLGFVAVMVVGAGKGTRELKCALPGFGATVTEKCAIEAGDFPQAFRQFRLVLVIEEIRRVNQLAGLPLQHFLNRRMRMTERIHADSAEKIEIALAGRVPEIDTLATGEQDFLPIVSRQQELFFSTNDGSQA